MKTPAIRSGVAVGIAAIIVIGLVIIPAEAHHSFAMYDRTIDKVLTGKLVRFIIGANHSQYIFSLVDEDGNVVMENGEPVQWGVETGPAVSIGRQGITPDSFKIGTVFTITLNPLRDGRNFGAQQGGLVMCGMSLPAGGCNADTGQAYGRGGF
jgi:hypothetical protein